jgi:hypothetical protein
MQCLSLHVLRGKTSGVGLRDCDRISCLDAAAGSAVSRWHFRMLNDRVRNQAYQRAIQSVVTARCRALDIGAGVYTCVADVLLLCGRHSACRCRGFCRQALACLA